MKKKKICKKKKISMRSTSSSSFAGLPATCKDCKQQRELNFCFSFTTFSVFIWFLSKKKTNKLHNLAEVSLPSSRPAATRLKPTFALHA